MHKINEKKLPNHSSSIRLLNRILPPLYHALYHELAWTYDAAAWIVSLGRWNDCILRFSDLISNGPILELGHGPGYLQMILNHRGVFTTGIDESRQMSRQARKRLLKQGGSYKLANGVGQALPFADSSFGSVVSTYPAPYIFEHITLKESYRVLNPGGELLIMLTVYFLGDGILKNFWAWIFRGALNPDADFTTVRQRFEGFPWQVEVLTRVFRDNRLLIIRCKKP